MLSSGDFGLAYLTERWAAKFVREPYCECGISGSENIPGTGHSPARSGWISWRRSFTRANIMSVPGIESPKLVYETRLRSKVRRRFKTWNVNDQWIIYWLISRHVPNLDCDVRLGSIEYCLVNFVDKIVDVRNG